MQLLDIGVLPPLPATAGKLLALAAKSEIEISELSEVISEDPPLAARFIAIANSAYFAPRRPVTTVREAILLALGVDMARNIAMSATMEGTFSAKGCPAFDLNRFWIQAIGTAELAAMFARATTTADALEPDRMHLLGLLHNIGELVLAHCRPAEMNAALQRYAADPETALTVHEREIIGLDHWMAGAQLARQWELPAFITTAIDAFETPNVDEPSLVLVRTARAKVDELLACGADGFDAESIDDRYLHYSMGAFAEKFDDLSTLARAMG